MFNEALIAGAILGLTLAIATGPSFLALIHTSIKNGLRWGAALAFGIFVSDLFYISLSYLGADHFLSSPKNQEIIGYAGGILLFFYGLYSLLAKKNPDTTSDLDYKREKLYVTFTKGFLLNTFNPAVPILWIGTMSGVAARFNFSRLYIVAFFSSTLITILGSDILKALVAHKIKPWLTPAVQIWLNRALGIILMGMAVYLMWQAHLTG